MGPLGAISGHPGPERKHDQQPWLNFLKTTVSLTRNVHFCIFFAKYVNIAQTSQSCTFARRQRTLYTFWTVWVCISFLKTDVSPTRNDRFRNGSGSPPLSKAEMLAFQRMLKSNAIFACACLSRHATLLKQPRRIYSAAHIPPRFFL